MSRSRYRSHRHMDHFVYGLPKALDAQERDRVESWACRESRYVRMMLRRYPRMGFQLIWRAIAEGDGDAGIVLEWPGVNALANEMARRLANA